MNRIRRALLAGALLAAAGHPALAAAPLVMGFSQAGSDNAWRNANSASIKAAAALEGITLKFSDAGNGPDSQARQIAALRSFISQKVDLIAFSPSADAGWEAVLREARAAGIPVIVTGQALAPAEIDLYKKNFNKEASEQRMVWIGRVSVVVAMALAVFIAPMLGIDKKGGFQYIQEYTGFVSPGILAMFLMGFFWKKTTAGAAMFATVGGLLGSIVLKFLPTMMDLSFLIPIGFAKVTDAGVAEIPFLDRMFIVFFFVVAGMVLISKLAEARREGASRHLHICLLYTSPSPRDRQKSRMPSSA